MEGFGEIVIGAGAQAIDPLGPAVACSEDQHRKIHPPGTPGLQDLQSTSTGQTQVQNAQVIGLDLGQLLHITPVGTPVDDIPRLPQILHQPFRQGHIILGKQQPHQSSSSISTSSSLPVTASYSSSTTRRSRVTSSSSWMYRPSSRSSSAPRKRPG